MSFKKREKPILLAASLLMGGGLLAAAAVSKTAGHWPMWGGTLSRNMISAETGLPAEFDAQGKNVKWYADLGSQAFGNPVVANGKVLVGTNNEMLRDPALTVVDRGLKVPKDMGVMACFREEDGEFLWQAAHDRLAAGRVNDWPELGLCSSPFIDGDRAYYTSNRCEVVCVDLEGFHDGENDGPMTDEADTRKTAADYIWKFDMMRELGVYPHNVAVCSPLVVDGRVFIVTGNGVDEGHRRIPNAKAPSFIALDQRTGKLLWSDRSPGRRILHGQWSNAVYGEVNGKAQVIFPGGNGWLYAFDPAGDPDQPGKSKLIWKFDCNPKETVYVLGGRGKRNELLATPVFHEGKVYVGVGQDPEHGMGVGHLWCIDASKEGDVSPELVVDKSAPDKPLDDERFDQFKPFDESRHLVKPNPNSALVWHYGGEDPKTGDDVFGRTTSTVAIHGDLLFAAELAGFLHCLDLNTGQRHWRYDMLAMVWGSPYVVDGRVYLGDEDGDVAVLAADKVQKELYMNNLESAVYSTPVGTGGMLYVMTFNRLYAMEEGASTVVKPAERSAAD